VQRSEFLVLRRGDVFGVLHLQTILSEFNLTL
jgi:hypothetical protein